MLGWRPFDYKNRNELKTEIRTNNIDLPISDSIDVLRKPAEVYGATIKNRLAIHPMTSFDCEKDGTPTELTFRRYRRFSAGGSGMIWFESCAVQDDSKSNVHDMYMTGTNKDAFKKLVDETRASANDGVSPFLVLQLSHYGRNSGLAPAGIAPRITYDGPFLQRENPLYLSDDDLKYIQDNYIKSVKLAKECGFDAVDTRACHGFLISELLSSFTRTNSIYGGDSFENRTRFLTELVDRINVEVGIPQALRLNVCDLVPFPYGWGMKNDGSMLPDLAEPLKLISILKKKGISLFSIAVGRNHVPHIQMPYNRGSHCPPEHQLIDMSYYHSFAKHIKEVFPDLCIISGALSWGGVYSPNIAAGAILDGKFDIAGFGRMAYANPDYANQILKVGGIDEKQACICCERCSDIRAYSRNTGGCPAGCVIRDSDYYMKYFRKYVPDGKPYIMSKDTVELFNMKPLNQ